MGDKNSKEAADEETTAQFFQSLTYTHNDSIDYDKFTCELGITPGQYCTYQTHLDKIWQDKDIKALLKTETARKALAKDGPIPDSRKREIVLSIFELNPIMCETKWEMLIAIQGSEFVAFTKKAKRASEHLSYNILKEKGKHELEMILTILFKERGIKHSPTIANFACLLLVFMRPSEVFYTLSKMTEISEEALKSPDTMMHMRWYFTFDKNQYLKCKLHLFIF